MSIRYIRDKKRYRYEFEAQINGERIRSTKLLPAGWNKAQAETFDRTESARHFAELSGVQRAEPKIEEAVRLYIAERCGKLKNGAGAAHELDRFLPFYQGRLITELPEVAKEYAQNATREVIANGVRSTVPLSAATIRNRLAYLRAACRYAFKYHNMGDRDPAERMQMPTVKNERHFYASRKEMLRIARTMPVGPSRAVIRIAFYSGMRLSEVLVAHLMGRECFLLTDTKNGDRRIVPIHHRILCCLKYIPVDIKKRWIQRQFTQATAKLGLSHLHIHDLRHSAASEMINSGVSLYDVGAILGHKSQESTKRYAHLATDTLAAAVKLIGRRTKK